MSRLLYDQENDALHLVHDNYVDMWRAMTEVQYDGQEEADEEQWLADQGYMEANSIILADYFGGVTDLDGLVDWLSRDSDVGVCTVELAGMIARLTEGQGKIAAHLGVASDQSPALSDRAYPPLVDQVVDAVSERVLTSVEASSTNRSIATAPNLDHLPQKDFYTTTEVAEETNRKEWQVRKWCRDKRVLAKQTGSAEWRISYDELVRYKREGLRPLVTR